MARIGRLLSAHRDVPGSLRTQRPTTSARVSPLASSATSARLRARQTLEALLGTATAVVASGGEWTNPEDRRDRAESASALAAEQADHHKGGARPASRGARAGHQSWLVATALIFRLFTRSAGREAGIARAHRGSRRSLPPPTTTRSILPKRLSSFATRPAPPPSPVLVLRRTASSAPTIRQP